MSPDPTSTEWTKIMMRQRLNDSFPERSSMILTFIALLIFIGIGFGKMKTGAESAKTTQPDSSAPDKDSDKLKIIINIVHTLPQDKDCPQLKYKSGELTNPCLIDEHWKIKVDERELTVAELQLLLVVAANIDRAKPNNPKTFSNRIVQIRADNSVPWHLVAKVMEACGVALIWKIEYGTEAIPVYLPKDNHFDEVTDEVRVSLIHNPISPLAPTILIGIKELKDWENFHVTMKKIAPYLAETKMPVKINPDSDVPFQMILKVIKLIRQCSETIPIEFSAQTPPQPKTPSKEHPSKKQKQDDTIPNKEEERKDKIR